MKDTAMAVASASDLAAVLLLAKDATSLPQASASASAPAIHKLLQHLPSRRHEARSCRIQHSHMTTGFSTTLRAEQSAMYTNTQNNIRQSGEHARARAIALISWTAP